uniref:Uncharacterized protein n=1 Tax=Anguilla anguilla TaxID=7936 RepID=A0A0E9WXR6_ANGAN
MYSFYDDRHIQWIRRTACKNHYRFSLSQPCESFDTGLTREGFELPQFWVFQDVTAYSSDV